MPLRQQRRTTTVLGSVGRRHTLKGNEQTEFSSRPVHSNDHSLTPSCLRSTVPVTSLTTLWSPIILWYRPFSYNSYRYSVHQSIEIQFVGVVVMFSDVLCVLNVILSVVFGVQTH